MNADPWQASGDDFEAGYLSGYLAGLEVGRERADAEAAALHHQAWRVVQNAAKSPTHAELDERRRARQPAGEPPAAPPAERPQGRVRNALRAAPPHDSQRDGDSGARTASTLRRSA
jgi:hypothetical protein